MIRVSKPADIPTGPHFAVLIYKSDSHHIPGDQRSRESPGHGYPEHTVTSDTFEHWVTCNKDDLQTKVAELSKPPKWRGGEKPNFVVLKVESKLAVTTRTTVDIG